MPRSRGNLKIQWIIKNASRKAAFRKRRATLLEKAKELSTLCKVPVAMVVYGPGGKNNPAEPPAFWPEDLDVAKGIMRRYMELPEAAKEAHRLDNEGVLRQSLKKMAKRLEGYKASNRQLEVNLVLNDISLGRRSGLDDLPPELAAAVRDEVGRLRRAVYESVKSLTSGAAAAMAGGGVAPEDEAAAAPAVLVSSYEKPLMVTPLAVAPPPPLQPELLLAPPQEPLMVPPLAMAAPMVADAAVSVGVGVGVNEDDDDFPRNGSYLLEVADAIMNNGSGGAVEATVEDVDRLLMENGLEGLMKPKPM